jgi:hypothetical protein
MPEPTNADYVPALRMPERGPWEVAVRQVGARFHVYPHQGLLSMGHWALSLNPKRSTGFWRCISGIYLRREWPRNEKALAKAIADCEEWCHRRNDAEGHAKAILDRTHSGSSEAEEPR